jgi:predicted transcriptional regulator
MNDNGSGGSYIGLTATIVSAYVSNNSVPAQELSNLINQVHSALTRVSSGQGELPS